MGKMFDMLHEALTDVLEYERGNVQLRTKKIIIPANPKNYTAQDIKKLRAKLKLSQSALATWLNVSLNAVQAWEQGVRNPSQAVLRLLDIFNKSFSSIEAIYEPKAKPQKKKNANGCITEKSHERMIAKPRHYSIRKKVK
jgi:DNA-binding transcriptional regulator YiaG